MNTLVNWLIGGTDGVKTAEQQQDLRIFGKVRCERAHPLYGALSWRQLDPVKNCSIRPMSARWLALINSQRLKSTLTSKTAEQRHKRLCRKRIILYSAITCNV